MIEDESYCWTVSQLHHPDPMPDWSRAQGQDGRAIRVSCFAAAIALGRADLLAAWRATREGTMPQAIVGTSRPAEDPPSSPFPPGTGELVLGSRRLSSSLP